jgi:hypothetical protein
VKKSLQLNAERDSDYNYSSYPFDVKIFSLEYLERLVSDLEDLAGQDGPTIRVSGGLIKVSENGHWVRAEVK